MLALMRRLLGGWLAVEPSWAGMWDDLDPYADEPDGWVFVTPEEP